MDLNRSSLSIPGRYKDMMRTSEDLIYPLVHDQTYKHRFCLYWVSLKYSYMSCMYYRLACITKITNINKTHIHLSPQIIAQTSPPPQKKTTTYNVVETRIQVYKCGGFHRLMISQLFPTWYIYHFLCWLAWNP